MKRLTFFLLLSMGVHALPALALFRFGAPPTARPFRFESGQPLQAMLSPVRAANQEVGAEASGQRRPAEVSGSKRFHSDALARLSGILQGRVVYPPLARRQGWEGRVSVEATVGTDGHAVSVRIAESSGHRVLDAAAEDAVRSHAFPPGGAVETTRFSFLFRLTGP